MPLRYYENNVGGTRVLLEQMTAHGVDTIVFSSSAAVYGEPEQVPIEETAPLHPTNCYGETKRVMEQMMRWTAAASRPALRGAAVFQCVRRTAGRHARRGAFARNMRAIVKEKTGYDLEKEIRVVKA